MGFIFQIIIGLVLSLASTLIQSMFQQDQKQKVPGVRGSIQTGGDIPLSFIMGFYATGGHLKYAGTWGNSGETPNAYFSKVVSVSDLPVRGLSGFFVNGERVTLAGMPTGSLGYAVLEYRVNGVDHLWVNFYNGNQTAADPLMLAQFGADPNRPYTSDMVGRGVAYFVATALVNRELFSGFPEYLAEVHGIPLSDPRGDSQHDNPMVGIYTLAKGLYFGGQWVYGPQNITDANFIAANLEGQMDKCDTLRDGTTEKRFRFGMEVSVDAEPHAIIGEMLKACEGRVAEIGGIYKFLVGEPDAPVVSFTDEDLVISEGQTYEPFPGLESLFNGMGATYPEPAEGWELKEAPPRYRSDLEVLDDNRRLPFTTQYKAVPFALQVQELMRAAIEEVRRFRRHTQTMPPEWWEYEPLDVAAWTSARNGYVGKDFLITAMDDLPNANQFVGLQEMDPSDYSWSTDNELPYDVAPLVIARPAPQQITGFAVEPYIGEDNNGIARRPGFRIYGFGAGLVDVSEVWVQARLAETGALVIDGRAPYDPEEIEPSAQWSGDPILPAVQYEVRGKLVPFSGRATEWSAWLPVTTPDVKLGPLDVVYGDIDLDELGEQVQGYFDWMGQNIRELIEQAQAQATLTGDQELANAYQFDEVRRSLAVVSGELSASFEETITVAIVPMQGQLVAMADALTELSAANDGDVNSARIRFTAVSGPTGYSRVGIETRFDPLDSGDFRLAGSYWDTPNNNSLPTRRMEIAEQFVIAESAAAAAFQPFIFQSGVLRVANAMVGSAAIVDAAITNAKIADAAITNAKIQDATITGAKIANASIGSAQIGDAAITNAKIANATIQTVNFANGAIAQYTTGGSFVSAGKDWVSATFTSYGFPVLLGIQAQISRDSTGSNPDFYIYIELENLTTGAVTVLALAVGVTDIVTFRTLTTGQVYRIRLIERAASSGATGGATIVGTPSVVVQAPRV
ncbi:phage tail protein [Devosia riboflavina]|uniref:phage tail protein n=1 Tax=Devosia riboflavina TaxID=46914 RepID=UPI00055430D5|nr:phage tail protein [Devosia riboflavina]